MKYALGAVIGLLWGAAAAMLNRRIMAGAIKKNSGKALLSANILRGLVDIAALAATLLLRMTQAVSFEIAIVGTAAALSMLTVIFAFQLSKPDKPEDKKE